MSVKVLENLIENEKEFILSPLTKKRLNTLVEKYLDSEEYNNERLYLVLDDDNLIYALMYDENGEDDFSCLDYAMANWGCTNALYYDDNVKGKETWSYL